MRQTKQRSAMRPSELKSIGKRLHGEDWRTGLADTMKVDRVTIWRWVNGKAPISEPMAIALRSLVR